MGNKAENIDKELLRMAASGHEPSFRVLYVAFAPAILRAASRYLHSIEMAEDVVQDTFLTLWTNRWKIDTIDSLQNYLFITARNQCFRILKSKAVLISAEDGFFEGIVDEPAGNEDEQFVKIHKAIGQLPPQQKKIFEMAKLKGLSHEKISKELNLSPSTINNHITTALRSVREYMQRSSSEVFILLLSSILF